MNLVYDQVMIAAKYSQEDCSLSSLIDDIEKEEAFNLMYQCTLSSNLSPTELVKNCHSRPSASTSEPKGLECFRIPCLNVINIHYVRKPGNPVIVLK